MRFFILIMLITAVCSCTADHNEETKQLDEIVSRSSSTLLDNYYQFEKANLGDDIQKICIGCGCSKQRDRCEIYNSDSFCYDLFISCHSCHTGGIWSLCIRTRSIDIGTRKETITITSLPEVLSKYGERIFSSKQINVLNKYLKGERLTREDYLLIDDPITI